MKNDKLQKVEDAAWGVMAFTAGLVIGYVLAMLSILVPLGQ